MTAYAEEIASSYADIKAAGAAITFTESGGATHDATTETFTPTTPPSVAGYMVEDASAFEHLDIPESLKSVVEIGGIFAATTAGEIPALNAKGTWAGVERTVRARKPIRPDGTSIICYVGLS